MRTNASSSAVTIPSHHLTQNSTKTRKWRSAFKFHLKPVTFSSHHFRASISTLNIHLERQLSSQVSQHSSDHQLIHLLPSNFSHQMKAKHLTQVQTPSLSLTDDHTSLSQNPLQIQTPQHRISATTGSRMNKCHHGHITAYLIPTQTSHITSHINTRFS
jgi:hypothetical protein